MALPLACQKQGGLSWYLGSSPLSQMKKHDINHVAENPLLKPHMQFLKPVLAWLTGMFPQNDQIFPIVTFRI